LNQPVPITLLSSLTFTSTNSGVDLDPEDSLWTHPTRRYDVWGVLPWWILQHFCHESDNMESQEILQVQFWGLFGGKELSRKCPSINRMMYSRPYQQSSVGRVFEIGVLAHVFLSVLNGRKSIQYLCSNKKSNLSKSIFNLQHCALSIKVNFSHFSSLIYQ
jgi:hypothetical protein